MEFEYHSFLLRLWVIKNDGQRRWMSSLECVATNEKQVFSNVEALLDYLETITSEPNTRIQKGGGLPQDK